MRQRYCKYLVPIEELRTLMDEALGEHSITEELFRMRGCSEELNRLHRK